MSLLTKAYLKKALFLEQAHKISMSREQREDILNKLKSGDYKAEAEKRRAEALKKLKGINTPATHRSANTGQMSGPNHGQNPSKIQF